MTKENNIELLTKDSIKNNKITDINDYDMAVNIDKQERMFKGTIIICVVYGFIAFILLLLTYFSSTIRDILFNKFLPFTMVYIIGTILIIMMMLYFIFTYVPVKITRTNEYDEISCPDYWKVEIVDDNIIKNAFDPSYPTALFKYKCIMDKDIYNWNEMYKHGGYDKDNNQITTANKKYKATNILSNLSLSLGASDTTFNNGSYDNNKLDKYNTNYSNYSNDINFYKNVNSYEKDDIKDLIKTNSEKKAETIQKDLRKIALLQNNYIYEDKNDSNKSKDIISQSNIWANSSNVLSPITWNYTTSDNISIGTIVANIKVFILDWGDLTPENAYMLGKPKTNSTTNNTKDLYLYYQYPKTGSIYYKLGQITITSNASNIPQYSMSFSTSLINDATKISDNTSNNIVNTTIVALEEKTANNTTPPTDIIELTNKIKVQFYNVSTRPKTILDAVKSTSNIPLLCDEVYPGLLASIDNSYNNSDKNNLRCAYSKICGIPWSDLRCDN